MLVGDGREDRRSTALQHDAERVLLEQQRRLARGDAHRPRGADRGIQSLRLREHESVVGQGVRTQPQAEYAVAVALDESGRNIPVGKLEVERNATRGAVPNVSPNGMRKTWRIELHQPSPAGMKGGQRSVKHSSGCIALLSKTTSIR